MYSHTHMLTQTHTRTYKSLKIVFSQFIGKQDILKHLSSYEDFFFHFVPYFHKKIIISYFIKRH